MCLRVLTGTCKGCSIGFTGEVLRVATSYKFSVLLGGKKEDKRQRGSDTDLVYHNKFLMVGPHNGQGGVIRVPEHIYTNDFNGNLDARILQFRC